MSPRRRKAFLAALLVSLLLHLLVLLGPGWHLGLLDREAMTLEARLDKPVPQPRPTTKPASPKPAPAAPVTSVAAPASPAEPAVAAAPVPPGPVPDAPKAPAPAPASAPVIAEAAPEVAPPLPRRGRIRFALYKGKQEERGFLVGQSVHEWRHDGQRYSLSAVSETVGLAALFRSAKVVQSSEGGFLRGELKPSSFRFDRGEGDVASASFDWSARQVSLGDGQVVAIGEGAEDMLSMFYQLMQAALRGEGFVMAVATGRKVERYAFEWLGEEALAVKAGRFHAWHVRIRAADDGNGKAADTTEVWLGREVAGLPVMIRQTDRKGEVFDLVAEEIDYEGKNS